MGGPPRDRLFPPGSAAPVAFPAFVRLDVRFLLRHRLVVSRHPFGGSTIMTPSHDKSDSGKKAIRVLEDASMTRDCAARKMVLLRRSQREAGPRRACCDELSFSLLA